MARGLPDFPLGRRSVVPAPYSNPSILIFLRPSTLSPLHPTDNLRNLGQVISATDPAGWPGDGENRVEGAREMTDAARRTPTARADGGNATAPGAGSHLKQERSIETRERLINAAIRLLRDKGHSGFSTMAVAEYAEVSRGALQYHFKSRDEIFIAVRGRIAASLDLDIPVSKLFSLPIDTRVRSIINHYWKTIGSADYVAALEIRLYERFNTRVHTSLMADMTRFSEQRNRDWVRIFADSDLQTDDLVDLRRFMLDVLRGIALRQIEEGPASRVERQLTILSDTLIATLQVK